MLYAEPRPIDLRPRTAQGVRPSAGGSIRRWSCIDDDWGGWRAGHPHRARRRGRVGLTAEPAMATLSSTSEQKVQSPSSRGSGRQRPSKLCVGRHPRGERCAVASRVVAGRSARQAVTPERFGCRSGVSSAPRDACVRDGRAPFECSARRSRYIRSVCRELEQMGIRPAHRNLDDVAQRKQRAGKGNVDSPPHVRLDRAELNAYPCNRLNHGMMDLLASGLYTASIYKKNRK